MWIDDQILENCAQTLTIASWVPGSPVVVLGSSNDPSVEVFENEVEFDGVGILKRYGGGGAVVLHTGCLIVSVGGWVKQHFQNQHYFRLLNQGLIQALAIRCPQLKDLKQAGISDIAWHDRKVAGTSLFRSRNYFLFQASVLVETQIDLIDRYLKHPSREPDYRRSRPHKDFLIGINEIDPTISPESALESFQLNALTAYQTVLKDELIAPVEDQMPHLLKRLARARGEEA